MNAERWCYRLSAGCYGPSARLGHVSICGECGAVAARQVRRNSVLFFPFGGITPSSSGRFDTSANAALALRRLLEAWQGDSLHVAYFHEIATRLQRAKQRALLLNRYYKLLTARTQLHALGPAHSRANDCDMRLSSAEQRGGRRVYSRSNRFAMRGARERGGVKETPHTIRLRRTKGSVARKMMDLREKKRRHDCTTRGHG